IWIGVGGYDVRGARLRGRDADDTRAGAEIECASAGDNLRMIENVARQGEAAAPVIGPVRCAEVRVPFGETPEPALWSCTMQDGLGHRGGRPDRQVLLDELSDPSDG